MSGQCTNLLRKSAAFFATALRSLLVRPIRYMDAADEINDTMTVRHNRQNEGANEFAVMNGRIVAAGVTISIGTITFFTNRTGGKCSSPFII